jgi:hypothetical protein
MISTLEAGPWDCGCGVVQRAWATLTRYISPEDTTQFKVYVGYIKSLFDTSPSNNYSNIIQQSRDAIERWITTPLMTG